MTRVRIEEQAERRKAQRAELIVRVEYASVDEIFTEFTRDINAGGVFIETDKPCPAGTEVAMHFTLPGGEAIHTVGRVVRTNEGRNGPPGMGIEFDDLDAGSRLRIDELVRSLRAAPKR